MTEQVATPAVNGNQNQNPTQTVTPPKETSPAPQKVASDKAPDAKPADAVAATQAPKETVVTPEQTPKENPSQDQNKGNEKVIPEKYELKIPDGSLLDPKRIEAISEYAKEQKLSNEEAQAMLTRESTAVTEHVQAQRSELKTQSEKWLSEAHADKEIGGDKFNESVEVAHRAMSEFFPGTQIKEFMNVTGFGNRADIIKGFLRMGRLMQDAKIQAPNGTGDSAPKGSVVSRIYDHPTSPKS